MWTSLFPGAIDFKFPSILKVRIITQYDISKIELFMISIFSKSSNFFSMSKKSILQRAGSSSLIIQSE